MAAELLTVYDWVVRTRATLLGFLETLPWEALTRTLPDVGHGSVKGILIHVAGCYRWWLQFYADGESVRWTPEETFTGVAALGAELGEVDAVVRSFLARHDNDLDRPFSRAHPGQTTPFTTTPRWLFTHTTTHEFHHKGQVVMLCRRLGHPPVETDLWEPDFRPPGPGSSAP